jgi:Mediator complex subunit 27
MLASYKDLRSRPCDKCLKLYTLELKLPVIRKRKLSIFRDGETVKQWEALHVACA